MPDMDQTRSDQVIAGLRALLREVRAENRVLIAENSRLRRRLGPVADRPDPEERKMGWTKSKH